MPTTTPKAPRGEGNDGLAKGLAIIESFTRVKARLSVSEAAAATNMTPAAARRCLRTLHDLGYVSYDGKFFRPTPRLVRLPNAYTGTDPLPTLAQEYLEALQEQLNESASLAVLDEGQTMFIARQECTHSASTGMRIGIHSPAPASAAGRALLLGLPEDERERLLHDYTPVRATPKSLMTLADIRERFALLETEGYDYTDEEMNLGVRAVAAPVRDVDGKIHGAITLSAISARHTMEHMREVFVPPLIAAAQKLGAML